MDLEIISGTYKAIAPKDGFPTYSYTLKLNEDGTFFFIKKFDLASPQCSGKWKITNDNTILLECRESANPYEFLTGGYMGKRKFSVKILDNNKLELDGVVLKRI